MYAVDLGLSDVEFRIIECIAHTNSDRDYDED